MKGKVMQKPEQKLSIITLGLLGIGGVLVADKALPVINSVLTGGIEMIGKAATLGVMAAGVGAVAFIVINPQTRNLISHVWMNTMQSITKLVISHDPIKILRNYVAKGQAQLEQISQHVATLNGKVKQAEQVIARNNNDIERANQAALVAKQQGNNQHAMLKMNEAGRLAKFNESLTASMQQTVAMQQVCTRIKNALEFTIADLKSQVDISERQYEILKSQHEAITGVKKWMNKNSADKQMFDQSMQHLIDDYGMKIGQIDDAMNNMQTFLTDYDIEKGVMDNEALARFEQWEQAMLTGQKIDEKLLAPEPTKDENESIGLFKYAMRNRN